MVTDTQIHEYTLGLFSLDSIYDVVLCCTQTFYRQLDGGSLTGQFVWLTVHNNVESSGNSPRGFTKNHFEKWIEI